MFLNVYENGRANRALMKVVFTDYKSENCSTFFETCYRKSTPPTVPPVMHHLLLELFLAIPPMKNTIQYAYFYDIFKWSYDLGAATLQLTT